MELIETHDPKWDRLLHRLNGYKGTCGQCGKPIEYNKEFDAVLFVTLPECWVFVPLTALACPNCMTVIAFMQIYGDINVTKEFEAIHKKNTEE